MNSSALILEPTQAVVLKSVSRNIVPTTHAARTDTSSCIEIRLNIRVSAYERLEPTQAVVLKSTNE